MSIEEKAVRIGTDAISTLVERIGQNIAAEDAAALVEMGLDIKKKFPELMAYFEESKNKALLERVADVFAPAVSSGDAGPRPVATEYVSLEDRETGYKWPGVYKVDVSLADASYSGKVLETIWPRGFRVENVFKLLVKYGVEGLYNSHLVDEGDAEESADRPPIKTVSAEDMLICDEINNLVGNHATGEWKDAKHQISLIEEEVKETRDLGIRDKNIHELRDGICDVLFTAFGLTHRTGVPTGADFHAVIHSQLSKFDRTTGNAQLTVHKYAQLGVKVDIKESIPSKLLEEAYDKHYGESIRTLYVAISSEDQYGTDGKFYKKGKFLKSHRFEEPVFEPLIVGHRLYDVSNDE